MPTLRAVPAADLARYRRLLDYAFHPQEGPQPAQDDTSDRIADPYGLYDDQDRLVATGALFELDVRNRGAWTTIGGIASVSSPPEHRGSGHVRALCRELLGTCADRGLGLVALWPFEHAFYRQFGWAIANRYTVYEVPPRELAVAGTTDGGKYEPVGPDDWDRLEPVQQAHGEGTNLSLRRSEAWWRERTFDRGDDRPWAYAWLQDGEVRGYVTYSFESHGDDQWLRTHDFSAADHEARRHLLGLLGTHDSQAETVRLYLAEEADLLDSVANPADVECSVRAGPMIRCSDVALALADCTYPSDSAASVVFEVRDSLLDGNDDQFELVVADGVGDCEPTTADPDAVIDVGTLSQLVVGYHGVERARRYGLDCDDETAELLRDLFPSGTVCLREFF